MMVARKLTLRGCVRHLFLIVFSSVFERCYAEFFFEKILKVRLAGKEQKITDCGKGTIGISQKKFCFLQFCFHNVSSYRFSCLFFELLHKNRAALLYMLQHVGDADLLIGMRLDKLQSLVHLVRISFGVLLFGNAVREVHYGGISELIDLTYGNAAFAFLRIQVDKLIGLLNVEIAADGSNFANQRDETDEDVFRLA